MSIVPSKNENEIMQNCFLNLGSKYHGLSYDALTAYVALVFTRYMLMSVAKRDDEDKTPHPWRTVLLHGGIAADVSRSASPLKSF